MYTAKASILYYVVQDSHDRKLETTHMKGEKRKEKKNEQFNQLQTVLSQSFFKCTK